MQAAWAAWEAWEVSVASVDLEASVPWVASLALSKCQAVQPERLQPQIPQRVLQAQPMPLPQLALLEPQVLQAQPRQTPLPPLVAWEAWAAWEASILS